VSLRRPAARITVDRQGLSLAEAAVAALSVDLGFGPAHDRALLALWSGSRIAGVAPGDEVALALGYGDELVDVLTGAVEAVDATAAGVLVEVISKTIALSRARVAQAYVQQSVADIVRDLVAKAGGEAAELDADAKLGAYHVDERRPVWSHLVDLARLASRELAGDADGKVSIRQARRGLADKRLRRGAELVAWQLGRRAAPPDPVPVLPYGAASEVGADAWHLVLRQPDGEQPSGPSVIHPAVRDRDLAGALDRGRAAARDRRAVAGDAQITGDAELRPGALIELTDAGELPTLRATAVRHVIDARGGFLTTLALEAAA
jgi:hypothetical protein